MTRGWIALTPDLAAALAGALLLVAAMLRWPKPPQVTGRAACVAVARRRASPSGVDPPGPQAPQVPPAVLADLVVALLEAGLPVELVLATLRRQLAEAGLSEPTEIGSVLEALDLAAQTGLAPAALVRAAATEQRRGEVAAHSVAAHRLAVLVVLPMGVCLLPAFMVLTVVPLVLGLLQG